MNFICGGVVGAFICFGIMAKLHSELHVAFTQEQYLIAATCAFFETGFLYGLYQDEQWLSDHSSVLGVVPARHSKLSRLMLEAIAVLAAAGTGVYYFFF